MKIYQWKAPSKKKQLQLLVVWCLKYHPPSQIQSLMLKLQSQCKAILRMMQVDKSKAPLRTFVLHILVLILVTVRNSFVEDAYYWPIKFRFDLFRLKLWGHQTIGRHSRGVTRFLAGSSPSVLQSTWKKDEQQQCGLARGLVYPQWRRKHLQTYLQYRASTLVLVYRSMHANKESAFPLARAQLNASRHKGLCESL